MGTPTVLLSDVNRFITRMQHFSTTRVVDFSATRVVEKCCILVQKIKICNFIRPSFPSAVFWRRHTSEVRRRRRRTRGQRSAGISNSNLVGVLGAGAARARVAPRRPTSKRSLLAASGSEAPSTYLGGREREREREKERERERGIKRASESAGGGGDHAAPALPAVREGDTATLGLSGL